MFESCHTAQLLSIIHNVRKKKTFNLSLHLNTAVLRVETLNYCKCFIIMVGNKLTTSILL